MVLFVSQIIRIFQLAFSIGTVFFSHNKSAETLFRLIFSAKRTDLCYLRPFKSSNLFICVIPVPKLSNRLFRSSNLFDCVIRVPKLINHPFSSSNLFKLVQLCHLDPKYCKLINLIYIYRTIQKL